MEAVASLSLQELHSAPKLLDVSSPTSPASPSAADALVLPATSPTFHKLQPGQDLYIPPRNWLSATLPDGSVVPRSVYRGPEGDDDADAWTLSIANHLDATTDFVAPAEDMKTLFQLPMSTAGVSLSVHRLGDTLILDRDEDMAAQVEAYWAAGGGGSAPPTTFKPRLDGASFALRDREAVLRAQLHSKFVYRTALEGNNATPPAPPPPPRPQSLYLDSEGLAHTHTDPSPCLTAAPAPTDAEPPPMFLDADGRAHTHTQEPPLYVDATGTTHTAPDAAAAEAAPTPPGAPLQPNFRRVCRWRFNGMSLVLGSDLLSFRHGDSAVSLRLQDIEDRISTEAACDMYLDNVMAGVPEVAVCYHDKGVVQSYQVVPTEDVPALPLKPFSPHVLEQNAATLLRFLQTNCTAPWGSYWLYRREGDTAVQLYDLATLPVSSAKQGKWRYMLATLCYRYASQLRALDAKQATAAPRYGPRRRELLLKSSQLLEELAHAEDGSSRHNAMRALVYEELAASYLDGVPAAHAPAPAPPPPSRRRKGKRKTKQAGPKEPTTEEVVATFNDAARCLMLAIQALQSLGPSESEDGGDGDGDGDGDETPIAAQQLHTLRCKLVAVGLDCAVRLIATRMWHTAFKVLDDALSFCVGSAAHPQASTVDLLDDHDVVTAMEVCGELCARLSEEEGCAADGSPPQDSLPPLPHSSVMRLLVEVGGRHVLPCLAAGGGFLPDATPSADTGFTALPAGRVAEVLGAKQGFTLPPLPAASPLVPHLEAVTSDEAAATPPAHPPPDAATLTAHDWLVYAVFCTWHALLHHKAAGAGDGAARCGRRCGELLNRWGRRVLDEGDLGQATAAFATAIDMFDAAGDVHNSTLVRLNVAAALKSLALAPPPGKPRADVLPSLAGLSVTSGLASQAAALFHGADVEQVALLEVAVDLCETAVAAATSAAGPSSTLVAQALDAAASSYLAIGVKLSQPYQESVAASTCTDLGVVSKTTALALNRARTLYDAVGNSAQAAAAHFQLGAFHAANVENEAVSTTPDQARVLATVADDHFQQAIAVFGASPRQPHLLVALLAHCKRAGLALAVSTREAGFGDATRARASAVGAVAAALGARGVVARVSPDAVGADAQLGALVDALRRALLAVVRADGGGGVAKPAYADALGVRPVVAEVVACLERVKAVLGL